MIFTNDCQNFMILCCVSEHVTLSLNKSQISKLYRQLNLDTDVIMKHVIWVFTALPLNYLLKTISKFQAICSNMFQWMQVFQKSCFTFSFTFSIGEAHIMMMMKQCTQNTDCFSVAFPQFRRVGMHQTGKTEGKKVLENSLKSILTVRQVR